ncbi:MAG: hypothetical protein MI746_01225 [Pseudomonadales bacterium]|nr:hypothetical protein [Pseudomonadales bacterium]
MTVHYGNKKLSIRSVPVRWSWQQTCVAVLCLVCLGTATSNEVHAADVLTCNENFSVADGNYPFLRQTPIADVVNSSVNIGAIHYSRLTIFNEDNPDENNALYRWANSIHFLTRQRTIDQQLLFKEGDMVEARLLDESARLLRDQDYLFDSDIRIASLCDNEAIIEVITKDNWSLTPNLSFDRSGGDNTYSIGIRESNLFGRGKLLAISQGEDLERESTEFIYEDPNVFGSRVVNKTTFVDSDDGEQQLFELALPFFSLDSRQSWGVRFNRETREDTQYLLGDAVSEVLHDIDSGELLYGWSRGLQDDRFTRWTAGVRYQRDRFSAVPGLPLPLRSPRERELTYPFVQVELGENRYATSFNFDEIYRTEDIYVGASFRTSLGYASDTLGSDQDRLIVNGQFSDTLRYDSRRLWQYSLNWEGIYNFESDQSEDVLISFSTRYFYRQSSRWSFFTSLQGSFSNNLSGERQILMGGDRGTRAFDTRFQAGDRSLVLSVEERLHTDIHILNLVRVGAAAFFDVGRAWEPGAESGLDDPWLANVGVGLRLMSSKAASSRIAHIDFAIPVTNQDHPAVDDFLIAFNIKSRF